ncbi:MAG: pentapeptide repeat-containing protein [Cyanobacteria bacterium J06639_18]
MLENLEEKKKRVYRERWLSNEGQKILKGAIEVLQNKQSLEKYFLSVPYFDYEWADPWSLKGTPMNELELSNSCFQELLLIDVQFRGANLKNSNFKGTELFDIDFNNADLTNVNFETCYISDCNFVGANLSGANFTDVIFLSGNLDNANLSRTNFTRAKLDAVAFKENAFINAIVEGIQDKIQSLDADFIADEGGLTYLSGLIADILTPLPPEYERDSLPVKNGKLVFSSRGHSRWF